MKKTTTLLLGTAALLMTTHQLSIAQTTLYSQDFNSGTGTFILNSADMSSTTSGYNTWVVNNSYTGGSATIMCMGFPFSATVGNTPAQPGGITSPGGNYLHILSTDAQSNGITNANYRPSDGVCAFDENYFCKTPVFSTAGYSGVNLSFWWMCMGSTTAYGELYYSTDGGASWTQSTSTAQYSSTGSWVSTAVSNPAFDNQASLQFGFRFVNTTATAGADPAFSIDDINVTGTPLTGISTMSNNATISLFPNPSSETTTLNLTGFDQNEKVTITVVNELGQTVLALQENAAAQISLNTSALSKGVYSVSITTSTKKAVSKFVKL